MMRETDKSESEIMNKLRKGGKKALILGMRVWASDTMANLYI